APANVESLTVNVLPGSHRFRWTVNALPLVDAAGGLEISETGLAQLVVSFSDEDLGNTHSATIDWGDGTSPESGQVDQVSRTVSGEHLYTGEGPYVVEICVSDDAGGTGCDTESGSPSLFSDGFESGDTSAWDSVVGSS
ncbi:MAG: hypothetical protein GY906_38020, partial [bacterium]|nr:hypothetical protein [bacterium]